MGFSPVPWGSNDRDQTRSLAWGDVDGDGDLDLAVGNWDGTNRIYLNHNGVLQTQNDTSWESGHSVNTWSVAWGDMDGDGDLDLAVGNCGANKVYLNQNGVLQTDADTVWESGDNDDTRSVAWGDVDGDGDLDLAAGNSGSESCESSSIAGGRSANKVYLNQNGVLQTDADTPWESGDSASTKSVAWGDVDGDGDLDLAAGNFGSANTVYLNQGLDASGVLSMTVSWNLSESDNNTLSVAWGDVDGDGDLDLATGDYGRTNKVYLNQGMGASGVLSMTVGWNSDDSDATESVAWGDVDGDGDLDLAFGGGASSSNKIYLNQTDGLQTQADSPWNPSASDFTRSVAWGDVDGDGDLDFATANHNGSNKVYLNQTAVLQSEVPWEMGGSDDTRSMAWGDVDGDGDLDLAVGNYNAEDKVYLNQNGVLQTHEDEPWSSGSDDRTLSVAWGDVDGDGDLDLASGGYREASKVYLNQGVDASGFLSMTVGWRSENSSGAEGVAWGDMDGDGDLDLATAGYGTNRVYLNQNGTLQSENPWESSDLDDSRSLAWGDVDGDGDLDLAVGNNGPNKIYLNQNGALRSVASWESGDRDLTWSVAWGDVDGDGDLDLAAGNNGHINKVYLNLNGMLQAENSWESGDSDQTRSVAWGDVDGDGDLDLAVGNFRSTNKVYLNLNGILQIENPWQSGDSDQTQSVAWGDVDRDGDLDLATGGGDTAPNKIYTNPTPAKRLSSANLPLHIILNRMGTSLLSPAAGYATPKIHNGVLPIHYTLVYPRSHPKPAVNVTFSLDGGGKWQRAASAVDLSEPLANQGPSQSPAPPTVGITNTQNVSITRGIFYWDVNASNFLGQSDNVVVRLVASTLPAPSRGSASEPGSHHYVNGVANSYQRTSTSTTSLPLRVRGNQVRVISDEGMEMQGAVVYRLAAEETMGALPYRRTSGDGYLTDAFGYLAGRGGVQRGDRLVALLPLTETHAITFTESVRLFQTNAPIAAEGLHLGSIISPSGVISLTVSPSNTLALFDLDISLEWDARNDGTFLTNLENAIKRASEVLFDVSDGQMALGDIDVYQGKEKWTAADIVIYANNNLRPRASMGGIVNTPIDENKRVGIDKEPILDAYLPGQIRMGPNWDPFGQSQAELNQDWWNALAHELAHYLLFLPDNYLAVRENPRRLSTTDCQYSFMTNAYDGLYSEFLSVWPDNEGCDITIAQTLLTGRTDWETINTFYKDIFQIPQTLNPGPTTLPLDVTQVKIINPTADASTEISPPLPARNYDLRNKANQIQPLRQAQAYLVKRQGNNLPADDSIIALGSTGAGSDRIMVRGAHIGDRVCVFHTQEGYSVGCREVSPGAASVTLLESPDWQPEINVRPVTSRTVSITVTFGISTEVAAPTIQVLPSYGTPEDSSTITSTLLTPAEVTKVSTNQFAATIIMATPAFEGFVRVMGAEANQEALTQFYVSTGFGPNIKAGGGSNERPNGYANVRGYFANRRSMEAPAASGDGKVTIFNVDDLLGDTGVDSLQMIPNLPHLKPWLTPIGPGYRVALSATSAVSLTIAFQYVQRDVPPGYEYALAIYHLADGAEEWRCLQTGPASASTGPCGSGVDQGDNLAVAQMAGAGIYALLGTVEMPPLMPGWNLFSYPIPSARIVAEAVDSIAGSYSAIYSADPAYSDAYINPGGWQLYSPTVAPEFDPYVNDLELMRLGRSYWISVTQPVTPYLAIPGIADPEVDPIPDSMYDQIAAAGILRGDIELPIGTIYGTIAGIQEHRINQGGQLTITARIERDGLSFDCGSNVLQQGQEGEPFGGEFVYRIHVQGRGPNAPDCASAGDEMYFTVSGLESAGGLEAIDELESAGEFEAVADQPILWTNHGPRQYLLTIPNQPDPGVDIPDRPVGVSDEYRTLFLPLVVR